MNISKKIRAIIGLGNPGRQYEYNRHNIGFRIVDALVQAEGGSFKSGPDMEYAQIIINDSPIWVIKPQTFMNTSGKVIPFLQKKGITVDEIIVVHDELELPYGVIKMKKGGSAKGHNGLKSIIAACGDSFERLRFGIGRPEHKEDVSNYVLSNFNEPTATHEQHIADAVALLQRLL